ncbi:MAG TPA: PIN domain-containing protein [Thermoanaerobaculia bacterium]
MASLVDTNVLVYSYDARFPGKRGVATRLLRKGIETGSLRLPHQVLVEFVAVVTRPLPQGGSLLSLEEALQQTEELLAELPVIYPNVDIVRLAVRGTATYRLSWFDAHLWAYAEYYGLEEILTEDFEHGRLYGTVRAVNPFVKQK